jgi:hypothetical protein
LREPYVRADDLSLETLAAGSVLVVHDPVLGILRPGVKKSQKDAIREGRVGTIKPPS